MVQLLKRSWPHNNDQMADVDGFDTKLLTSAIAVLFLRPTSLAHRSSIVDVCYE